jgi:hypothetical protein
MSQKQIKAHMSFRTLPYFQEHVKCLSHEANIAEFETICIKR